LIYDYPDRDHDHFISDHDPDHDRDHDPDRDPDPDHDRDPDRDPDPDRDRDHRQAVFTFVLVAAWGSAPCPQWPRGQQSPRPFQGTVPPH